MEKNSVEKCKPIYTLEELNNWKPPVSSSVLQQHEEAIRIGAELENSAFRRLLKKDTPKTLVCHDMKGGYLDDCYLEGSNNCEAYSFTQWYMTDIFIYFSHHFITIPPPSWVHCGHIHGVMVLGTIITEWDDGNELCAKIFASKASVNQFVESLVRVTTYHNFDGWLVNIENKVKPEMIENVEYFLRRLKTELVVAGNPGQIIWYDSITKDGTLDWQNELSELNRQFFDACDAIFLNYTWSTENLAKSVELASERIRDVFVGVDVFGRNCYGGGGFNTSKALAVIRSYGLSVALFAPGWVHENHPASDFLTLNSKFWTLLLPYLYVHGPTSLPIRTSFCPGFGKALHSQGKVVKEEPWHNMSKQQLQPLLGAMNGLVDDPNETNYGELKSGLVFPFGTQKMCQTEAFEGGQSLHLSSAREAVFPLFVCHIPSPQTLKIIVILKATKLESLKLSIRFYNKIVNTFFNVSFPVHITNEIEDEFSVTSELNVQDDPEISKFLGTKITNESDWAMRGAQIFLKTTASDTIIQGMSFFCDKDVDCNIGYFSCF